MKGVTATAQLHLKLPDNFVKGIFLGITGTTFGIFPCVENM